MGFEQLAALRDQLAAQAKNNNAQARKNAPGKRRDEQSSGKQGGDAQRAKGQGAEGVAHGKGGGKGSQQGKPRGQQQGRGQRQEARAPQQPAREVDPVILAISRLQRRFPKTFPKHPDPKFPLKLGIHKDLILQAKDLQLTEEEIKTAVKTWCEGRRYWTAMVEGAARIDLQGESTGTVTAEEAQRAKHLAARARSKAYNARKQAAAAGQPADGQAAPEAARQTAAEHAVPQEAADEAKQAPVVDTPATETPATGTPAADTPAAEAPAPDQAAPQA